MAGKKIAPKPAIELSWEQVRNWRLKQHLLHQRTPRDNMLKVVTQICGLHAQLMSSAELSLWARVENITQEEIQQALWEKRTLVKTWAMRGTLHLLPSEEYWLWQAALSNYKHYLKPSWFKYFGVTREELEQMISAIATALDNKFLTRQELALEVSRLSNSPTLGEKLLESWGTMLKPATYRGFLCFAPGLGQNVRFTRPSSWLGTLSEENPEHAFREVTRRFLATYAPVSREDFGRWWAISPAQAQALIDSLGEAVSPVEVEGTLGWMLTEHLAEATASASSGVVRLLPAFDPYIIGVTSHAENVLPGPFKDRIYRQQGWVSAVVLVDGRMDGIWQFEKKGSRLLVQVEPFVPFAEEVRRGVEEEAERLANFIGGTLDLSWQI